MRSILFTAFVLTVLVSCNNTDKPETTDNSTSVADSMINAVPLPDGGEPATSLGGDASGSTSTLGGSSSTKLNPPHGEPGHRCEIAVGAPLDSEPNATINGEKIPPPPSEIMSPAPSSTTILNPQSSGSLSGTKTAPGMNPPHGEPGHDCAIPVGAPLKK